MAKIADGAIYKFKTGDVVDADVAPSGGALNPIFETIRVALNHTDDRVDGMYTKTEVDVIIANATDTSSDIDAGLFTDPVVGPTIDGGVW